MHEKIGIHPWLRETLDAENSLKQNGKTFHWARRFLGDEMGADAASLYAFCRILDDMADGDIEDGPRASTALYADLKAKRPIKDNDLEIPLVSWKSMICPRDVVIALIDGLLMDQKPVAMRHEDDLIRYGYHVAGTVGVLMCSILNLKPRDRWPYEGKSASGLSSCD